MMRNILFIIISFCLYYILNFMLGKSAPTVHDLRNRIFGFISLSAAIGLIVGTSYWGTKIPGSFFERGKYEGMFYVNIFPDAQKVKSYRVPALIQASVESDSGYDDRSYSWREYRIDFAVMPNGGIITFHYTNEYLALSKTVTLFDDNERYWGIELTDLPAMRYSSSQQAIKSDICGGPQTLNS